MSKPQLQYIVSHEATYKHVVERPEIAIQYGYPDDGVEWEFAIRWYELDGPAPRLEVFDDAWQAFSRPEVRQLLSALAFLSRIKSTPQPADVAKKLDSLGFKDVTKRGEDDG